jgi:hypothetical protein
LEKQYGGQERLTVADEERKKKSVGGEEGKSLYGGASERGESAGGAKPSLVQGFDWLSLLPVDADFAKWADGKKYRYLLQYYHFDVSVCIST